MPQTPKPCNSASRNTWWQNTTTRFKQTNSVLPGKGLISIGTNFLASQAGITGASGATGIPTLLQTGWALNSFAAAGSGPTFSAVGWTALGSLGQGAVVGTAGFISLELGVAVGSGLGGAGDVVYDIVNSAPGGNGSLSNQNLPKPNTNGVTSCN